MQNQDTLQALQTKISNESQRIARQQKRVEKLSIEFGREDLREQAKVLLASMIVSRSLLEVELALMQDEGAPGPDTSGDREQDRTRRGSQTVTGLREIVRKRTI